MLGWQPGRPGHDVLDCAADGRKYLHVRRCIRCYCCCCSACVVLAHTSMRGNAVRPLGWAGRRRSVLRAPRLGVWRAWCGARVVFAKIEHQLAPSPLRLRARAAARPLPPRCPAGRRLRGAASSFLACGPNKGARPEGRPKPTSPVSCCGRFDRSPFSLSRIQVRRDGRRESQNAINALSLRTQQLESNRIFQSYVGI